MARNSYNAVSTNVGIERPSDFKIGNTYTISLPDMMVGKLLESHLFGYRFLILNQNGQEAYFDIDYTDVSKLVKAGSIKLVV